MKKKRLTKRTAGLTLAVAVASMLSVSGCVKPIDIRSIAEGQFISFVNALLNTATSDAIRTGLGG